MPDPIMVTYGANVYPTNVPFLFKVELVVEGIPTGVGSHVWGKKRAIKAATYMANNGNDILNQFGKAQTVFNEVRAMRLEEAMARVQVGDSVKLLVDIGTFKKGRVCKIVEVAEPSFYVSRGTNAWDDDKYPIKVIPVHVAGDTQLGPKDAIPLARGEFGPLDTEVDE
jgi:hypothetical protein